MPTQFPPPYELKSRPPDTARPADFLGKLRDVVAIAKVRNDPQEVGEIKRVLNSLLQNLDDRANVGITVAITNHHALVDNAVWRRFENQIQLGMPEGEVRATIPVVRP